MAESQKKTGYHLPEDSFSKLEWIRDSLKLLQFCADDARDNKKIELSLLGNHLAMLNDYLGLALETAEFSSVPIGTAANSSE